MSSHTHHTYVYPPIERGYNVTKDTINVAMNMLITELVLVERLFMLFKESVCVTLA